MRATIILVRHAAHDHLGVTLSGRLPGLALSAAGREQAAALAERFAGRPLAAIHSSPALRARQTAEAIASASHDTVPVHVAAPLDEIDFGEWTGRDFAALADDPAWQRWNAERATARAPGGETMAQAQVRALAHVDQAAADHPGQTVLMISHCDIIRAIIVHYLGLSLGEMLRFDIDPASSSALLIGGDGGRLLTLNEPCREPCR